MHNDRIQTWEQLLKEEERLKTLIQAQKELVRYDLKEIGKELTPLSIGFSFLKNLTSRDGSNKFINYSVDIFTDIVIKKMLLAKSGWLAKLVVPFFVKNYSSNLFSGNAASVFDRLKNWVRNKTRSNHKEQEQS